MAAAATNWTGVLNIEAVGLTARGGGVGGGVGGGGGGGGGWAGGLG